MVKSEPVDRLLLTPRGFSKGPILRCQSATMPPEKRWFAGQFLLLKSQEIWHQQLTRRRLTK